MKIHIVRHGNSVSGNKKAKGYDDELRPLSPQGITRSQQIHLPTVPKVVFISPAVRAKQTAWYVLDGVDHYPEMLLNINTLSLHQWQPEPFSDWLAVLQAAVLYGDGSGNQPLTEMLDHFGLDSEEVRALKRLSLEAWEEIEPKLPKEGDVAIFGHAFMTPAVLHLGAGLNGPFVTEPFLEGGVFSIEI